MLENQLDILIITETWLMDNESDELFWSTTNFSTNNFNCFKVSRKNRRGGGVLIIAKPSLECQLITKNITNTLEILALEVLMRVPICALYHPPFGATRENNPPNFNDELT